MAASKHANDTIISVDLEGKEWAPFSMILQVRAIFEKPQNHGGKNHGEGRSGITLFPDTAADASGSKICSATRSGVVDDYHVPRVN